MSKSRAILSLNFCALALAGTAGPCWAGSAGAVPSGAAVGDSAGLAAEVQQPAGPLRAEAGDLAESNDIVVTARRREETVQDVPAVVNAVTSAMIEKLNLRKIEDIAAVVPGLSLVPQSNGIGSTTTIRGVNFDVRQSGNNGTVEFYYNDAPIAPNPLVNVLFDVERIEVLRGPQGTLRGRASPSGSINVAFRRPDLSQAGGSLNFTVNDIDGYNFNGAINVPIIADKLGIRIAGVAADDDGNRVHAVANSQSLQNRSRAGRFSVRANPFDDILILDFNYQTLQKKFVQYDQVESVNQYGPTSTAAPSPVTIAARDRLAPAGLARLGSQNYEILNWQAQLTLLDQRLTYVGLDLKQQFTALSPVDFAGIFPNGRDPNGTPIAQPNNTTSHNYSHEVRLQNVERVAGVFDYVVGYLKYKNGGLTKLGQIGAVLASPAPPALPTTISNVILAALDRPATSDEQSVFGNLSAHIGDKAEITGGLRHIWYKADSAVFINGVENPAFRQKGSNEATIYTASAKYNFSRDLMAYATLGTSWRAPTVTIGGPNSPTPLQLQYLSSPAEKSKNYEVGIKSSWLDGRLTANLTGYWQKFDNYPYRTGSVFFVDNFLNSVRAFNFVSPAKVEVRGVEAELGFAPSDNLRLGAVLAYADGKLKDALLPCLDLNNDGVADVVTVAPTLAQLQAAVGAKGVGTCASNIRSNNSAPFSASFTGEYAQPLSERTKAYLRGLLTVQGRSQGDPTNAFDQVKAYGILNLYAGLRDADGNWELSFYAKNLTNTFRVLTRTNGPGATVTRSHGTLSFTNYYGVTVTDRREFGVNLRMSFGSR